MSYFETDLLLDSGEKFENPKSGTSSISEDSEEINSVEDANVTLTENNPKEVITEFKARKNEFQAWFDFFMNNFVEFF